MLKTEAIRTQRGGACKAVWKVRGLKKGRKVLSRRWMENFKEEEELVKGPDVTEKLGKNSSPLDLASKRTLVIFGRVGPVEE